MSSVFKTVDGALAFRGGFDSHALSQSAARATYADGVESERGFRRIKAEIRRQSRPAVWLRVMRRWAATRPKGSVMIATARRTSSSDRGSSNAPTDEVTSQSSRLWIDAPT